MKALRGFMIVLGAVAASLFGLAALALVLLLTTSAGAQYALLVAAERVPGELSFGGVDGSMLSGLELDGARYRSEAFDLELETLTIEPSWGGLLDRRLVLDRVEARIGALVLHQPAQEPSSEPAGGGRAPPALPELPDSVSVRRIDVADVRLEGLGRPVRVRRLAGSVQGPQLRAETLEIDAEDFALEAALDARVSAQRVSGSMTAQVALPGEARRGADADASQQVALAGDFSLDTAGERGEAVVEWTQLAWSSAGTDQLRSPSGRLVATPWAQPMGVELSALLEGERLPGGPASLAGRVELSGDTVNVRQLQVEAFGGTASAIGTVDVSRLSADMSVDFADIDPSVLDDQIDGVLDGRFDVELATEPSLRVDAAGDLEGELGGRPVVGSLRGTYADEALDVEHAYIELEEGHIELAGTLSAAESNLSFSAQLPELENWYPPVTGSVVAAGTIAGETDDPAVDLDLDGENLAWEALPGVPLEQITMNVEGRVGAHEALIEGRSELGTFAFEVVQGYVDERLQGTLVSSVLNPDAAGTWKLARPAAYTVGTQSDRISLDAACYVGLEEGRLCFDVSGGALTVDAQDLPNTLAEPWLPDGVRIAGRVDAELELMLSAPLEAEVTFHQQSLSIGVETEAQAPAAGTPPEAADASAASQAETGADSMETNAATQPDDADALVDSELIQLLELADIRLSGSIGPDGLEAELSGGPDELDSPIEGRLTLSPLSAEGQLDGFVTANITDISVVGAFVEGLEDLDGEMAARVEVRGSPQNPELLGTLVATGLGADIPALGIQITDGRLTAEAEELGDVAVEGELCSMGCANLTGRVRLPQDGPWALEMQVEGERIRIVDLPEISAVVAPRLQVQADGELVTITGTLGIPQGLVEVEAIPRSAVRPAPETVVYGRGEPVAEEALPFPLAVDIEARLGDVRFEGLGIEAELDGVLEVERTVPGNWMVNGTSVIEQGTFRAYGQELVVEQGLLIFTGPPENPELDIRATREVEDSQVGLTITGTARNPRSVVFSEDGLAESEAFARLVTGRSLEDVGQGDSEALERAAIGLGLRRALPTLGRLGESLGLDELGIDASGESEGAIVAGRRLSNDVYLRYKHGLFDEFAGLELIYRITERFRLRTETGTAQAIDVIYELRRGAGEFADQDVEDIEVATQDSGRSPADVAAPDTTF